MDRKPQLEPYRPWELVFIITEQEGIDCLHNTGFMPTELMCESAMIANNLLELANHNSKGLMEDCSVIVSDWLRFIKLSSKE